MPKFRKVQFDIEGDQLHLTQEELVSVFGADTFTELFDELRKDSNKLVWKVWYEHSIYLIRTDREHFTILVEYSSVYYTLPVEDLIKHCLKIPKPFELSNLPVKSIIQEGSSRYV